MKKTRCEIKTFFKDFNIRTDYLGIKYMSYIINLTLNDEQLLTSIAKFLYRDAAKFYGTSVYCVERDIRTVVQIIWSRGNRSSMEKLAGRKLERCPSNGEFLNYLTSYFREEN